MLKRNRKKENIMFQKDQMGFFHAMEKVEKHEGKIAQMETFVEFWAGL